MTEAKEIEIIQPRCSLVKYKCDDWGINKDLGVLWTRIEHETTYYPLVNIAYFKVNGAI